MMSVLARYQAQVRRPAKMSPRSGAWKARMRAERRRSGVAKAAPRNTWCCMKYGAEYSRQASGAKPGYGSNGVAVHSHTWPQ